MRRITISLLAGAVALTGSTAAFAQQERRGPPQDLTRDAVEQRTAQLFKRLDVNGDGKMDAADRAAREKAVFDRIDADHNGEISYAEFTAMREQRGTKGERRGMRGNRDGDGPRMGMRGKRGGHGMNSRGMLRQADANHDGAITLAELQTAALTRFDAVDSNKDGTISPAERKAQRDKMRDNMHQRRAQSTS